MPHVRVTGPCTCRAFWEAFEPRERRDGDRVVRAIAAYLSRDARSALVECAVIEGFQRQVFLAQLLQKDDGVLVRLFHVAPPERTEGVRFCLAWIGAALLGQSQSCRWEAENLGIPLPPV